MKLKDLKEWGGRDLPGFGDEATWGGRRPHGEDDDDRSSLSDYMSSDFVSTADMPDNAFIVPVGAIHHDDDEASIKNTLKVDGEGIVVSNDTGHDYAKAFHHCIQPMWDFACGGEEERYVSRDRVKPLQDLVAQMGKKFSMTDLQAGVKKWMDVATDGPTTKAEIEDALNNY